MSTNNFKFKVATAVGDTFTDASVSDILLNAVSGTSSRSILAGFTSASGGVIGPSALRVASNGVVVTGSLTASNVLANGGTFTTLSNVGNFASRGLSNVGGVTYVQSLSNAGTLSSAGGDMRIDNNGVTTMLINQYNSSLNTNDTTGYWKFASVNVGSGGNNSGGVDIQGSFSRVDMLCDIKFVSNTNNYASPYYSAVSELSGSGGAGKVLMYLNTTTAGASVIDYYIYATSYTRASFIFRGSVGSYSFFNPVAVFGAAPTTSATYTLIFDTTTMSVISKGVGQLGVVGALNVSGNTTLGSNLTVGSNLAVTSTISCATISAGNLGLFRNRIINGDMRIDQRFSGIAQTGVSANSCVVADRFTFASSNGVVTTQQQTNSTYAAMGASLGVYFTNYVSITVTTANASPATTDSSILYQAVEGTNIADFGWGTPNALPVVLSFYVYSNAIGTYSAGLRGGGQSISFTFSIATKNVWRRVVLTVPGDTLGTWAMDTTNAVQAYVTLLPCAANGAVTTAGVWQSGSISAVSGQTNFLATAGNSIAFTGFQLEKGTLVTPFEFRPYQTELSLCQRYFSQLSSSAATERLVACAGYSNSSTGGQLIALYQYPVPMRATPTFTSSFGSNFAGSGAGISAPVTGSGLLTANATDLTGAVASVQGTYATTSAGCPSFFSGFITSTAAGQYMQFSAEIN